MYQSIMYLVAFYIVKVPFPDQTSILMRINWFKAIDFSELRAVHDYYIAEMSKNFEGIILIGQDVCLAENE